MKFWLVFPGLWFFVGIYGMPAVSQNLVPNGSFEGWSVCPGGYCERPSEFRVFDWRAVSLASPDYFHACSVGEADVPYNWAGISDAYEGEGYIGLFAWMGELSSYREYAQCRLTMPLTKDSTYLVEFHYKLSSYSKFCVDRMGMLLTDTVYALRTDRAPNIEPTFHVVEDSLLTPRTGSWETGRWTYRARGGEQYLTVGNFSNDAATEVYEIKYRTVQEPMLALGAYYFIDDVQVVPKYAAMTKDSEPLVSAFRADEVEMERRYVLRRIQFEFNSYKLMGSSFDELDALALYLLKHDKVSFVVSGHTDDVGNDRYNVDLSRKRAETVAGYLKLQGIGKGRMSIEGHGKSMPLDTTGTEAGQAMNRRVEIRFMD